MQSSDVGAVPEKHTEPTSAGQNVIGILKVCEESVPGGAGHRPSPAPRGQHGEKQDEAWRQRRGERGEFQESSGFTRIY